MILLFLLKHEACDIHPVAFFIVVSHIAFDGEGCGIIEGLVGGAGQLDGSIHLFSVGSERVEIDENGVNGFFFESGYDFYHFQAFLAECGRSVNLDDAAIAFRYVDGVVRARVADVFVCADGHGIGTEISIIIVEGDVCRVTYCLV